MDHHPDIVLGIGMPHGFEWIVILVAMLLIFGKRLPEIMRGLGGSVKEFKKGMDEGPKLETPVTVPPPPPAPAPAPHATISRDWIPPSQPMAGAPLPPPAAAPAPTPPSEPK